MTTNLFGLRPYQQDAIVEIEQSWAQGIRSIVYQLPTGGGKSRIIRTIVDDYSASKKTIYVIAHRNTLVKQLSHEISEAGINHGIIKAGSPFIRYRVQVCSMQTLVRRMDKLPEPEIIIIDEFHHSKSASYLKILNTWLHSNVLGLTATPQRSDGNGLSDVAQKLIQGPTVKQLMADGFLSDYEYYAPVEVDMSGVKIQSGEYNSKEATSRVDKHYITGSAVEHYKRYADHMPAIACCVTIAHSEHVAQEFRDAGYKAIAVNSRMDAIEVERSINGLKTGTIEILCQCEMLGEGVDVPGATVLIGLRPTASLVIYLQHIGRVLRKSPGKDKAIILDHVGNWSRFGLPDDDRVWSLEGKGKKAKEASTLKRCPDCLRPVAIATRVCPYCGYQWTETAEAVSRLPEEKEGQLINIRSCGKQEQNSLTLAIARGAHSLKQAIAIAKSMGYEHKNAYAIWVNILHNNS